MRIIRLILFCCGLIFSLNAVKAQELEARVTINHRKISQTSTAVFDNLQTALTEFINNRQWTGLVLRKNERIRCSFNIVVNKYNESMGKFDCTMLVQVTRPVFNSTYTTTVFALQDNEFHFQYQAYDKLEFRPDAADNQLTALIAYYAYLIIGMDADGMESQAGTEAFKMAQTVVNNSQSFPDKGWKAFENAKNRYAIINDLLDNGMEPFRNLQYTYYRKGLDQMAEDSDIGRNAIKKALELLKTAHENKPMSALPQIFTEYKADELVQIFKGKGNGKEREEVIEILSSINASKNPSWNQIR